MVGIETTPKRKVKMFYLDDPKDVAEYEKILNNPKLTIINREREKIKETHETIDSDHVITKDSTDRIVYIIDYAEEIVEG